ncbi:transcriptional regulator family: Fungal Specific TF [Aspergillus niger]|nr:transcriptional regulator family: Fungal Specific TF [Aspergillus niger]KAI3048961.1 transcriptional regulator family: Fungal Specific TF [Aspergillus niger]
MPRVAIFRCFGATGPRSRGPGRSELATLFVQHEAIVNIPFSAEFNMSSPSAQETIQERRHRLSLVPRACEGCKVRKIRCDRKIPCSNCQASKITCRHPNDRTRNQLQADRIAHLEALVDSLDKRFRDVESKLVALQSPNPNLVAQSATNQTIISAGTGHIEGCHIYEGDTSFTSQSLQASRSAQDTALSGNIPDIEHSLDHIQKTLHDSQELSRKSFYFNKSSSKPLIHTETLPATLLTSILRRMRARHPIFLSSYAISDLEIVEDLCKSVLSETSRASVGQVASMHGVLFFVLKEFIAMNDGLCQKFDLTTHLDHCEKVFAAAMETYDVLALPSFENILALTMGMFKAQGEAKPSLYWRLVSAAAAHCQSLGYHRETTYRNILSGKADNIRRLFWTVYIFDKNMSLLLGRVSNMQGVMIDVRYPAISSDLGRRAWDESFIMGIRLAEFQDRIFTSLYNAATSIEDASERARLISDLESAMEQWHLELKQINPEGVNNILVFKLSRTNWDISFYSTLTLLLHASSKTGEESQISSRCFNAARNSLLAHLNSFPQYQSSKLLSDGEYFNWILLFSSLTPFLVIFLHAISEKDTESVGLLSQVVGTFETFRKVSHGAERLYQVCTTFTNIAEKIIQSQQSSVGIYDQQGSSLRLPDTPGSMTRFHPEDLQDMLDIENGDRATSLYASDLLNEFLSGEPFSWNRFDYDIGNGQ